jgi:hypothetical protein
MRDFLCGDFNRDGTIDIATLHFGSDKVNILIGDGNGGFSHVQTFTQSTLLPIISGDIDNDGQIDLVLNLSAWIGNGNGTFKPGTIIGGNDAIALDVGDINVDGINDIVSVDHKHRLSIIFGSGLGLFQGHAGITNSSESYFSGVNVATGDFNGDGNQDIAVSMYPSDVHAVSKGKTKVSLYFGTGYNAFVRGPVIESDYEGAAKIFAIDLNGDGKTDIALHAYYALNDEILIFLNNGNGNFQGPLKYEIERNRSIIKLEDFNGDGYPDIITNVEENTSWGTSSYGVSVHAGNGDGTFRHHYTIPLGERPWDWHLTAQPGDFNNDGHQDIIVHFLHYLYGRELKVILNDGGRFDGDPVFEMNTPDDRGILFTGDFDNDGNVDLVITSVSCV